METRPLRICIISQYFPPDIGGASTRASNAIKGLRKKGHLVYVVTAFPHYPHGCVPKECRRKAFAIEGDDAVRVVRVWVPPLPHEGAAKRLVMYACFTLFSMIGLPFSGPIDVIWAVSPNYFSSYSGLFYKLIKRRPLVLDVVDLWPEALLCLGFLRSGAIAGFVSASVGLFYKLSDGIVTLNLAMKREILGRVRNVSKVFIVKNTVDPDVFRPSKAKRPWYLKGKFVVAYSGNLGPMYDFDTVLGAAKNLMHVEDLAFVLRGNGELAAELKEKITNLKNVYLFTDVLDVEQVVEFPNMADAFLLPMRKLENCEVSFPLKLVEYLSCGKPVICCANGETAKFVYENNAGVVVEPEDVQALSKAIIRLHEAREYREELGNDGRKAVLECYSYQRMAAELENAFEKASRF